MKLTETEPSTDLMLSEQANAEIIKRIAWLSSEFEKDAEEASGAIIRGVNRGRQIGLLFQELTHHEQLNLPDFQKFSARLPHQVDFNFARKCVWLANNLETECKTLADARHAEQLFFTASGYLDEPKRLVQQTAKEDEPFARWAINQLSSWTATFEEKLKAVPLDQLPEITKESLKERLRPFVEIYERLT